MAVSTASSFRPGRKQSLSTSGPGYHDSLNTPSPVPPSPSPGPPSSWSASTSTLTSSQQIRNPNDGGIGSSLISATGPGGVPLSAGAPLAANTMANKPAIAGSSLYQACLTLLDRLWCVPQFGELFLLTGDENVLDGNGEKKRPEMSSSDPVTQLWQCFRLGAPLCWLINQLQPRNELPINPDANRSNANECKRQVAKFIIALNSELGWDSSDIFTISQLYLNDTNGFVSVVRCISKLLDVFESRGLLVEAPKSSVPDELQKPTDDRAWIVRELLDTERKYVQDLEVMQSYCRALSQNNIVSPDTIHNIFGNLNMLVDVQRRFLICIEENVRRPADDQHFGHVFRTMEGDFAVYEPFCANYANALEIIGIEAPNLLRLRTLPGAEDYYLEPSYELPTFLIKPVQRICKYPLLLESLLKKTPENAPYYQELVDGLQVIRRITDKVNETRRVQENMQIVRDLEERVEDWKGHNISTFGNLLLSDIFMVSKSETEREYHVYLFEKILLCCKEIMPNAPKKNSKSNSLLSKQKTVTPTPPGKKPRTALQLKGRIFINNVTSAIANSKVNSVLGAGAGGQYSLQVWWRGDVDQESFSLRCKNEEQLKQWQTSINRLIEEVSLRKQHIAAHYSQSGGVSPGLYNMAGAGANGRRSGSVSHSLFPQTPSTDMAPSFPFTRADSQAGMYRHGGGAGDEENAMAHGGTQMNGSMLSLDGSNASGRVTPMGGRYSQPAEHRERQLSLSTDARPRARTEDQDSAVLSQWRSHSPAAPPMPRNGSTSSTAESNGVSGLQQIRKASSSRQLRQGGQAHPHAFPRPPLRQNDSAQSYDTDGTVDQMENLTMHGSRSRVDSASSRGTVSSDIHHSRSRSASNPAQYNANVQSGPHPPMPAKSALISSAYNGAMQGGIDNMAASNGVMHMPNNAAQVNRQRFSSSSISTVDSQRSSHSRPGSTAASSPIMLGGNQSVGPNGQLKAHNGHGARPHASSSASMQQQSHHPMQQQSSGQSNASQQGGHSNAIKLVIHHNEDKLVVVVLSTVGLAELTEKVSKKIRVISGKKVENIKIRYIDEDGDRILMQDDEDVQMAFETSRQHGTEVDLVIA